jgi:hypothetical protein
MPRRSITILVIIWALTSIGCSRPAGGPSAETALKSKTEDDATNHTRLFRRETLNASRTNALAEFINPEVRMRLDQEPGSQDEVSTSTVQTDEAPGAPEYNPETEIGDDGVVNLDELQKLKFSWTNKKFAATLKKDETTSGVLVLYADENFYDVGRLTRFIEEGRDKMAEAAEIDPGRITVVFGGYKGLAQLEFWLVAQGEQAPEPKPDRREADDSPQG